MCFSPSILTLTLTLNCPFPKITKDIFLQQYTIDGYHFVLGISLRTIITELRHWIRVLSWDDVDDVDGLFTFNFDCDLILTFSHNH